MTGRLAVFSEGPYEDIAPFREFMGYAHPWYSTYAALEPPVSGQLTCGEVGDPVGMEGGGPQSHVIDDAAER
jgi:hypothetical protein